MNIERIINNLNPGYSFETGWEMIVDEEREHYLSVLKSRLGSEHALCGRQLVPLAFCERGGEMIFTDKKTGNCYGCSVGNDCKLLADAADAEEYMLWPFYRENRQYRGSKTARHVLGLLLWLGNIVLLPSLLLVPINYLGLTDAVFFVVYDAVFLLVLLCDVIRLSVVIPLLTAAAAIYYMIRYRPCGRRLKGLVIQIILYIAELAAFVHWFVNICGKWF